MKNVAIVIAGYNEERNIASVIGSVIKAGFKTVILVDDGSRDKTGERARLAGATVLTHVINRGQGAALKTGIDYALSLPHIEYIVTFDADGQHQAYEIKDILRPVMDGKADIALGSRFLSRKSNAPPLRKLLLKGGIVFTWALSGIKLTDTHNGFRAMNRKAAQAIEIKYDRMEHASEIIDEIQRKRLRYVEVPVTITYSDQTLAKGQSNLNALRIAIKMIYKKLLK